MKGFKKTNKFLLAKNAFEYLAFSDFEGLNELADSLYSSLDKELAVYDSYVKKRIEEMPKDLHDEFLDYMSDDYWKYEQGFPHIAGYLLLVRYYSLLEYSLRSIGQNVQHDLTTKLENFTRNLNGSLTERYLKYLKDVAGFEIDITNASWTYIRDIINPIRNCITHDDGYIESSKKTEQLKQIISTNPTLLSLTNYNKIEIKKDFIYKYREVIESFFKHLFQVWKTWGRKRASQINACTGQPRSKQQQNKIKKRGGGRRVTS